jgi:hypothetical protein
MKYYNLGISSEELKSLLDQIPDKQDKLVSGQNIMTINGLSILGEGDIVIESGSDVPEDIMAIINSLYSAGLNEDFNEDFAI